MLKNIPIFINNFNRLSSTKKLVEDLFLLGYKNVKILDNNSTYKPLLNWYDTNPCKIIRLNVNLGSKTIYHTKIINAFSFYDWVVLTDPDIELNPKTPDCFIDILIEKANKFKFNKVGLALKIDDLPKNDYTDKYIKWESKYWQNEIEKDVYIADVDTTFCIIKPNNPFGYKSLRIAGDMVCKHLPWYTDFNNLSEEELYYLTHSKDNSNYKRWYYKNLLNL